MTAERGAEAGDAGRGADRDAAGRSPEAGIADRDTAADPGAGATAAHLVRRLGGGDRRALARAISRLEEGGSAASELVKEAFARAGDVAVVGITGPSGAGKSTLVDALTAAYRDRGTTVGILAVDPSSPLTGGALLGDRVRMQRHAGDAGVYVRSMATRGAQGGLAGAAWDTLTLMAAAGLERLLVETVGVGQDEVDVAGVAGTTCVVLNPGAGDEIQAIKAGLMEVGDIFVLNKSDLPDADRVAAWLRAWVGEAGDDGWTPLLVRTVATDGEGVDELVAAIARHEEWGRRSGAAAVRRRAAARLRLRALVRDALMDAARRLGYDGAREDDLVESIVSGRVDPHSAAAAAVAAVLGVGAEAGPGPGARPGPAGEAPDAAPGEGGP